MRKLDCNSLRITGNTNFKKKFEVFSEKTQHTLKMADANEHTLFQWACAKYDR